VKLSIIIPAHNEEGALPATISALSARLSGAQINHEIIVVNDNSRDNTRAVAQQLSPRFPVQVIDNTGPNGYGLAVRLGIQHFSGDAVAIVMADASDAPEDVVKFFQTMESKGVDCVFGSRFIPGGRTIDYPWPKKILNRFANLFIRLLFGLRYNDMTNAFKMYRREVILGTQPLLSHHFNLTVELPLKAIIRGYSYEVVPNIWINRKTGISKFKIKEMGSRYLFIVIYCWLEKWLSRGNYLKKDQLN